VPALTTSILFSVERHLAGTASAVLNTACQVGGATGVAIFGAIVASGTGGRSWAVCGVQCWLKHLVCDAAGTSVRISDR
jgi:hypothetical protein